MNKRLLVVTNNRFWSNRIGSNARTLTMLQHLRARGWVVSVAFLGYRYTHDTDDLAGLEMPVSFSLGKAVEHPPEKTAVVPAADKHMNIRMQLNRIRNFLRACVTQWDRPTPPGGLPGLVREIGLRAGGRTVSDHQDARHLACVRSRLQNDQPEWVLSVHVTWAWLQPAVQAWCPPGVRWAIDTQDIQHERQARFHALGEVHGLDISRREESRWLDKFDLIIAIQARDAELLRQMSPGRTIVCAMHPQVTIERSACSSNRDAVTVGFLGSDMTPNILAARELVERIWPAVLGKGQVRAKLLIAGRVCEHLSEAPLPAGALLLGQVPDLSAFYGGLDIVVCPVRMGGGLKIKIVEALCRGKALVTTDIGAEGLESGAGTAFLVANREADFVDVIVQMISDFNLRERLSTAALDYARAHFTPDVAFSELTTVLEMAS